MLCQLLHQLMGMTLNIIIITMRGYGFKYYGRNHVLPMVMVYKI